MKEKKLTIILEKIKWIFNPQNYDNLEYTYAQVPTPHIIGNKLRVFFSGRIGGKSRIYHIDISMTMNFEILDIGNKPLLQPNDNIGTFDDEGVMPSCIIEKDSNYYMFYSGWNSRNTIPYHNSTGIAKYNVNNNQIIRLSDGPVMERNFNHPYIAVTPEIWKLKNSSLYECLYVSGIKWKYFNNKLEPIYVIKYASSNDLINWNRPIQQVIPSLYEDECFSNPTVYNNSNDEQYILFCSRNAYDFRDNIINSYKLGFAYKKNNTLIRGNVKWLNEFSDCEDGMQCYPHFFYFKDEVYILYNGNSFGKTGFGVAKIVGFE